MRASPDVVEADFIASMVYGQGNESYVMWLSDQKDVWQSWQHQEKGSSNVFWEMWSENVFVSDALGPLGPSFCLYQFLSFLPLFSSVEAMATSGEGMSEAWEQLAATWVQMESLGLKSPVVNMSSQLWTLVVVQIGVFQWPVCSRMQHVFRRDAEALQEAELGQCVRILPGDWFMSVLISCNFWSQLLVTLVESWFHDSESSSEKHVSMSQCEAIYLVCLSFQQVVFNPAFNFGINSLTLLAQAFQGPISVVYGSLK